MDPSTINDVLIARIDRLEERTRELVKRIASIIGRNFFDRILKEVAASIEDIDNKLACLKDLQLIRDRIRMEELEYFFKHALAQEAAYESTLLQQRKQLHLKVAESIERIFSERLHEFYGLLALHYSRADNLEKAEEYMTRRRGRRRCGLPPPVKPYTIIRKPYVSTRTSLGRLPIRTSWPILRRTLPLPCSTKSQWVEALKYIEGVLDRWGAPLPKKGAGRNGQMHR